jgi:acetyl/propionyl-CoA carboxylase alpha subunit
MANLIASKSLKSVPESEHPTPRRALVFGRGGAAELIARRLKEEGFEPETAGEPLPALSDTQALEKLRTLLRKFAEKAVGPASEATGAPCLHPGVSVWAERAELATLGEELGLDVICPPARVLALFANKLNLLSQADQLGIPHLVMNFDPIYSAREIERLVFNQSLGRKPFPFVLKSAKGGGSFGLFVVQEPGDLERKIPLWVEQVRRNLGEVSLFAERYLESARHILVPFVRYMDGRFRTFPMTDASLQSRYRKVVEFCPASGVSPEMQKELAARTRKLADHCGYVGVGTLEFLVDASRAYLVEGSARLNTGFHLWERVAGTSAVSWQLSALEGGAPGDEPYTEPKKEWAEGVAIRLYAEDSLLQLPQPGIVRELSEKREWRFAGSRPCASAELDLQVTPGTRIDSTDYGMLGTLWVGAEERKQALHFARGVLNELWISGSVQTNERFLNELLAHPWVQEGIFHAGFVDEEFLPSVRPPAEIFEGFQFVAAEAARAKTAEAAQTEEAGVTVSWAVGDQLFKPDPKRTLPGPRWSQGPEHWEHQGMPGVSGRIALADGRDLRVSAFPLSAGKWQVRLGTWVLPVRQIRKYQAGSRPKPAPRLLALVQGRVHAILYREGAVVPAHEPLVVLDSLGMLVPHAVPVDVRIVSIKRAAEEVVQAGDELAELEIVSKG